MKFSYVWFFLFLVESDAKEKRCTSSGHHCESAIENDNFPCESSKTIPKLSTCRNTRDKDYISQFCDYCPELHPVAISGPTFRPNITACRQEDGFYKCQLGSPDVNCVRRTWIRKVKSCHVLNEATTVKLNCTDDEVACRLDGRCVKRYDLNTDLKCEGEARRFYIRCHDDEFECHISKRCLPRHWVRDGSVDCIDEEIHDTSDEDQPLLSCNPQTEFRCQDANGRCIPREMVMDGRPNCPDSSDESQVLLCYNEIEFKCQLGGRCVRRYRVNDGFPDCEGGTDENVYDFQCKNKTEFDCGDGRCIPRSWVRNSLLDCRTGIDEKTVLETCYGEEFMCLDKSRCLPKKYLCDGIRNCEDCSDEIELCDQQTRFKCKDNASICIPWSNTCDDANDCRDGSDEETYLYQGFKFNPAHEACYLPQGLLKHTMGLPNKFNECVDGNGNHICTTCLDGKTIILKEQVCDGIVDCRDLSDECPCTDTDAEPLCKQLLPPSTDDIMRECNITKLRGMIDRVCDGTDDGFLDETYCYKRNGGPQSDYVMLWDRANGTLNYKCRNFSDYMLSLAQGNGVLHLLDTYINFEATKCNGILECAFFDDECECDEKHPLCSIMPTREWRMSDDFWFKIQACPGALTPFQSILPHFLCDGMRHCDGGEDEINCENRFECDAGTGTSLFDGIKPIVSIEKKKVCNNKADCIDSSDEMNCTSDTHFYCTGKEPLFIDKKNFLDGHADCLDYSDECPLELYTKNPFSSPTHMLSHVILKVVLWVTAIVSVLGNTWVFIKTLIELRQFEHRNCVGFCNRTLIAHLALADLMTGVSLWMLIIKSLQFSGEYCIHEPEWKSSPMCQIIGSVIVVSTQTSLHVLVFLTAMRLFYTLNPMRSGDIDFRIYCGLAVLAWSVSIFLALYPVVESFQFLQSLRIERSLYFKRTQVDFNAIQLYYVRSIKINALYSNLTESSSVMEWINELETAHPDRSLKILGYYGYYSTHGVCFPDYFRMNGSYFSLVIIINNVIALAFIVISYVIMYKIANKSRRQSNRRGGGEEQDNLKRRITLLVMTNTACWLPICVMALVNYWTETLPEVIYAIAAVVLLPINSCFNPIIYSQFHCKVYNFVNNNFQRLRRAYREMRSGNSNEGGSGGSS